MRDKDDSGASLVEFVLVFPVFMMLLLGMFTGGVAYSRKLSIAQAVREGARYGATLPTPGTVAWFGAVGTLVINSADGELASGQSGRSVCVAYVQSSGTATNVTYSQSAGPSAVTNGQCPGITDTRTETRVQVIALRNTRLEALVFSRNLVLKSQAIARFEAG